MENKDLKERIKEIGSKIEYFKTKEDKTEVLKEIDEIIVELKALLDEVPKQNTEVYSRIVGYYRAINNWNTGKLKEYEERKVFDKSLDDLDVKTA